MNKIVTYLYKTRFLKLKKSKIEKWVKNNRIENLLLALELGDYNIRISALIGIAEISPVDLESILTSKIDDPISSVSLCSIRLFEENFVNHEIGKLILNKKQFWELAKVTEQKNLGKHGFGNSDPLWVTADFFKTSRTNNFNNMQSNMSPNGSGGNIMV